MINQVIVVGGGLAGLSAAHTVIERGGRVLVLDKSAFMGGNSTKATSGINGALTRTQMNKGIPDSPVIFEKDIVQSFHGGKDGPVDPLSTVLAMESGAAVDWLINQFGLDLSLVSRLGGHSFPRTHRGKERFPGMTITMALMEKLEKLAETIPDRVAFSTKADVKKLILENNAVIGVEYEKDGKMHKAFGDVILATGGFGADFTPSGILARVRPDLLHLPTTNGPHTTGDGIKMCEEIGASTIDLDYVQVHPTGLINPAEPDAKTIFLAAEALRGVGALILNKHGKRFVNELGRRDHVSAEMFKNHAPFRLILNSKASKEIEWHCKHYTGRGLMKRFNSGAEVAKEMGIDAAVLKKTFEDYSKAAAAGKPDEFGKKFFDNAPYEMNDDTFHVAIITPVIHYCMGGLKVDVHARVQNKQGTVVGLYAAGEVLGGIHGKNRLGGNSLLDCVVFGRVSGLSATQHLLEHNLSAATRRVFEMAKQTGTATAAPAGQVAAAPAKAEAGAVAGGKKTFTAADVAKHKTEKDCWVIVNGEVLDVTDFLKDHPGGKKAILLFAGRDASEEYNMLHKPDTIKRYAPQCVIGTLAK